MRLIAILLALVFSWTPEARAHEIRPAVLQIVRKPDATCTIRWKQPESGTTSLNLRPHLSGGWLDAPPNIQRTAETYSQSTWTRTNCTLESLRQQSIVVAGLDDTITDVLLRVDYGDGHSRQFILRPGDEPVHLEPYALSAPGALAYGMLGVEHILTGFDHLSFVLALVLLVGFRRRLAIAVSGFTIAHSFTLGATALGLVHPWSAYIEAMVALSIIFVAAEVIRVGRGQATLISRWPALASAGFGLLHGFAFAGAIAKIGLPKGENVLALLLFNLGVEIGQLLFIALMFVIALAFGKMQAGNLSRPRTFLPYAIGAVAAFWFFERAGLLFQIMP